MSSAWKSPQSIYNFGHSAIRDLLTVDVQTQEKVDGSFFAFGLFPESELVGGEWVDSPDHYELKARSKGAVMNVQAPPALFKLAVDTAISLIPLLTKGYQYRGETLAKPKHNALAYDRVPKGNIILFDVCIGEEDYLPYDALKAEAERLGLEVVPQLATGRVESVAQFRSYLDTPSVLGGQKIEGVVVKPLVPIFGVDKKALFGKFVSEAFKEVHRQAWGESNPTSGDILTQLGGKYGTQTRWNKAIQHLREADQLEDSPRDIGPLIKEIPVDIEKECTDQMKEDLFRWAWPHVKRLAIRGFPEYYKQLLLEKQFEKDMNVV